MDLSGLTEHVTSKGVGGQAGTSAPRWDESSGRRQDDAAGGGIVDIHRRDEAARETILNACTGLVRDGRHLTMEAIAQAAGVGKQTLYRWWPSKGAVVAEAMNRRAHTRARVPDTGTVHEDLTTFLADTFAGAAQSANQRMLRRIMAGAQQGSYLTEAVADFTATRREELRELLERGQQRGEIAADVDLGVPVDQAYGVLWYRLLLGHAPLDRQAASGLADNLMASALHR
ncbi:AcrR family transcriptional regulator [Saccharopolyspora lacisalsi]|uniref:AcrR family transcriptional regulator n=1 Tax=Halosaccharopolyspora lacisalsi TaxID=1000566 RepID=A0A839DXR0_9PSEU|nr:AcrR family transcriptional regulator [Halosaccharopolyspora lacisalsi]